MEQVEAHFEAFWQDKDPAEFDITVLEQEIKISLEMIDRGIYSGKVIEELEEELIEVEAEAAEKIMVEEPVEIEEAEAQVETVVELPPEAEISIDEKPEEQATTELKPSEMDIGAPTQEIIHEIVPEEEEPVQTVLQEDADRTIETEFQTTSFSLSPEQVEQDQ